MPIYKCHAVAGHAGTPESKRRFGPAISDLVVDDPRFTTSSGRVSWAVIARETPEVGYDTLRKAVSGGRLPSAELIERVAGTLGVEPTYFAEYRLHLARREFDAEQIGWESALDNLSRWGEAQSHPEPRGSQGGRSSSQSPSRPAIAS